MHGIPGSPHRSSVVVAVAELVSLVVNFAVATSSS